MLNPFRNGPNNAMSVRRADCAPPLITDVRGHDALA